MILHNITYLIITIGTGKEYIEKNHKLLYLKRSSEKDTSISKTYRERIQAYLSLVSSPLSTPAHRILKLTVT